MSAQTNHRAARRRWQQRVQHAAIQSGPKILPFFDSNVHLTLVHLVDETELDVDNIIKPIQDGLELMFYFDDIAVTDVDIHRRPFSGLETSAFPPLLQQALDAREECVYVRIESDRRLEDLL